MVGDSDSSGVMIVSLTFVITLKTVKIVFMKLQKRHSTNLFSFTLFSIGTDRFSFKTLFTRVTWLF